MLNTWMVCHGSLRSRCHDGIRCAKHLLREMLGQIKGVGSETGKQAGKSSDYESYQSILERERMDWVGRL